MLQKITGHWFKYFFSVLEIGGEVQLIAQILKVDISEFVCNSELEMSFLVPSTFSIWNNDDKF